MPEEIGRTGLNVVSGGVISEEILKSLHGRQALDTFKEMRENDPVVGAALLTIDMLIRQVEWDVKQHDADEEDAEFLRECMDDMSMSWGDFVSEAFSMLPFGFSFAEIVYKTRNGRQREGGKLPSSRFSDGKVGWRKLAFRAQDTLDHWEFDDGGGLKSFIQVAPPDYREVEIPIIKGLLFRTSTFKNNPEGRSVLRNAYEPWYYKKRIQQIEGTGIERDLAGFPTIWLPPEYLVDSATTEQKAVVSAFETIGRNIRRDKQEFLLMPLAYDEHGNKVFDFTLMSSGGTRQFDTNAILTRYNQGIAMSLLSDFILLGHEKVGSFALSSDKTDLFAVALGTFLDQVQDVMNRFAVPRLFELNGLDLENLPAIEHGDIEMPDLGVLGTYISALHNAGVPLFPDEDLEAHLRQVAKLPEKSDETKQLQEAQRQAVEEQFSERGTGSGSGPAGPDQDGSGTPSGAGRTGSRNPADVQQGGAVPSNGQRGSSSAGP